MNRRFGFPKLNLPNPRSDTFRFALLGVLVIFLLTSAFFLLRGAALLSWRQGDRAVAVATKEPAPTESLVAFDPAPTATTTQVAPPILPQITATPTPSPSPTSIGSPTPQPTVDDGDENAVDLHSGPGSTYPVVGQVRWDQAYEIVARDLSGAWYWICCPMPDVEETWVERAVFAIEPNNLHVAVVPAQPTSATSAPGSDAAAASSILDLPKRGDFDPPDAINPLTGEPLADRLHDRRPLVICINNEIVARPQRGISRADVMYEYLMEGLSITRLSGIFYGSSADPIGPMGSARLIDGHLAALYDAGLACSNANEGVRFLLRDEAPFPYLDVALDDSAHARYVTSAGGDERTRLRTSTSKLRQWLMDWHRERAPLIRGFTFGAVPRGGAPASVIVIPYPSATNSQVAYWYDVSSRRYLRSLGGQPHVDGNDGSQITVDNVIVQFVPPQATEIVEDSADSKSIHWDLFEGGNAIVFRNGLAFEGTWRSESRGDTPRFYDSRGSEIPLKSGKTWISIVPPSYSVRYQ